MFRKVGFHTVDSFRQGVRRARQRRFSAAPTLDIDYDELNLYARY